MTTRIAINGFGRIGRSFFKLARKKEELEIVAINDLAPIDNIAYLLSYDSVYGRYEEEVSHTDEALVVGGDSIPYLSEPKPGELPWGDMDIDVVIESTGVFDGYEKSRPHIEAGAKKVVISAPVKDAPQDDIPGATVLMGVNEEKLSTCTISANASCTTNAAGPLMAIIRDSLGIEKALLNTVHGYTASQNLIDSPNEKRRRGRAAAQNIVPSSTGAAIATTKAVEGVDAFDGISLRVPVVVGSIVDITFLTSKETTAEEVNDILRKAAEEERWQGIFSVTEEDIVSTDIIGNTYASIADLQMTRVVGGNLVKVLSWYDNEMGYTNTLVKHVIKTSQSI
ncbi:MAG: glyceraldehyde 3-phosphate dehydrogenase NAD-binding domain-containing protein [Candidatus Paceibacterota bacterium]